MTTHTTDHEAIIRQQVIRISWLEARVREYQRALRPEPPRFPRKWGLTPVETRILALLMRRGAVSDLAFILAMHGETPHVERVAPEGLVKVRICLIRKKLAQAGVRIAIHRERQFGYFIEIEDRKRLKAWVEKV